MKVYSIKSILLKHFAGYCILATTATSNLIPGAAFGPQPTQPPVLYSAAVKSSFSSTTTRSPPPVLPSSPILANQPIRPSFTTLHPSQSPTSNTSSNTPPSPSQ